VSQMFVTDDWKVRRGPQLVPTIYLSSVIIFNWGLASTGLSRILCEVAGLLGMGVASYILWCLARNPHPTIEISDGTVSDGSLFRFGKRKSVPIADIAGVSLGGDRLELRTTAAGAVQFWVGGLSIATRGAAREAIENAIRAQEGARSRATPRA
jgi:hypothetical protein